MRIENGYERGEIDATVEDALDLINYVCFYIKQVERGQRG